MGNGEEVEVVHIDDELEKEVEEHGKREVAKINDARLPSRSEFDMHNLFPSSIKQLV